MTIRTKSQPDQDDLTTVEILLTTLYTYGSLFIISIFIFSQISPFFPNLYNICQFQPFVNPSSNWRCFCCRTCIHANILFTLTDEQILESCGYQAFLFVRSLRFGSRLCKAGMMNSIWLIPLYVNSFSSHSENQIKRQEINSNHTTPMVLLGDEWLERIDLGHVPNGSSSLLGATVAAYVVFGWAMRLLWMELDSLVNFNVGEPDDLLEDVTLHLTSTVCDENVVDTEETPLLLKEEENEEEEEEKATDVEQSSPTPPSRDVKESFTNCEGSEDEKHDPLKRIVTKKIAVTTGQRVVQTTKTILTGQQLAAKSRFLEGMVTNTKLLSTSTPSSKLKDGMIDATIEKMLPKENKHSPFIGKVLGTTLALATSLFWTCVMSFATSFTNITELKKIVPFLDRVVDRHAWVEQGLAQLKPLVVVCMNNTLPIVLWVCARLETTGRSDSCELDLQILFLNKLCLFFIIQTFYVQLISGSILSELQIIIHHPSHILFYLAQTLPHQAGVFLQYVLVETMVTVTMSLWRVSDVVHCYVRHLTRIICVGRGEKEEEEFFKTMVVPAGEFDFVQGQASLVLYFVIVWVYSILSPITSFVMWFCFGMLILLYKNQFVTTFPKKSVFEEKNGLLVGVHFVRLMLISMLIGQGTLFGVLILKEGVIACVLLVPLIIGTAVFSFLLSKQYNYVGKMIT